MNLINVLRDTITFLSDIISVLVIDHYAILNLMIRYLHESDERQCELFIKLLKIHFEKEVTLLNRLNDDVKKTLCLEAYLVDINNSIGKVMNIIDVVEKRFVEYSLTKNEVYELIVNFLQHHEILVNLFKYLNNVLVEFTRKQLNI